MSEFRQTLTVSLLFLVLAKLDEPNVLLSMAMLVVGALWAILAAIAYLRGK